MKQKDRSFLMVFAAILGGLVLLSGAVLLIAQLVGTMAEYQAKSEVGMKAAIAERLQPVGNVVIAGEEDAASAEGTAPAVLADSGIDTGAVEPETASESPDAKALYAQSCMACHDTGAAGAPKVGDQAAWVERIAQGQDTLIKHALEGFNAMPPKGGAAQLGDAEITAIVEYMVTGSQ